MCGEALSTLKYLHRSLLKSFKLWYNTTSEGVVMKKSFDELTIADDFMFCKVMPSRNVLPCTFLDFEF